MPEKPSRPDSEPIEVLFAAVLELPPAERVIFLDGACRGDVRRRERVESLLRAHEASESFLPMEPGGGEGAEPRSAAIAAIRLAKEFVAGTEQTGDRIDRYRLCERVGEGGCGVVYVAEQEEPVRRRVALKVIKLGLDSRQVVARFEAEPQALAMMDHPNIARVFDAGRTEAGRPYFVMELVGGSPITTYCDQNHISIGGRLELFIRVCHAIQHAHQKGIIHRDIKPSNILVTLQDGVLVPKVIDFGIAKATEGGLAHPSARTESYQLMGTPAYMSPEQAEMRGADIDTRSDIYSLGVLLYELLTSRTPCDSQALLRGGFDEMRRTIREKEAVRPSARLGGLSAGDLAAVAGHRRCGVFRLMDSLRGDLDWIVMKALEKDRTRRYETANSLGMDIRRHLDHEAVIARPPSAVYRLRKMVRRNRLTFTAAGVVAIALILATLISARQAMRATRAREGAMLAQQNEAMQRRIADEARRGEAELRRYAEIQERRIRQQAYASDMNLAQHAMLANNLGRARELLDRQRPRPGGGGLARANHPGEAGGHLPLLDRRESDLRGWEWRYLWGHCRSDAEYTLCQRTNGIYALAASRDAKWLAIGEGEAGGLSLWDLSRREEIASPPGGDGEVMVAVSTDPPVLACSREIGPLSDHSRFDVCLWDIRTRRTFAVLPLEGPCRGLAFSENGLRLLTSTGGREGQITIWETGSGRKLAHHAAPQYGGNSGHTFAVTRDMALAVHQMRDPARVRVIDLATGAERWTAPAMDEGQRIRVLAFSADGRTLASAGGWIESRIRLWDVASGREIGRLEGHRTWVGGLDFSEDGRTLVSASADQTIRLWDTAAARPMGTLRGHSEIWALSLLADGRTLLSGAKNGVVSVWDTERLRYKPVDGTLPAQFLAWRFAPDSQSIVTADRHGHIVRWSGVDFQQRTPVRDVGPGIAVAEILPDCRRVVALSTNGILELWDLPSGTAIVRARLPAEAAGEWRRLWTDGSRLMLASYGTDLIHQWDLATGRKADSWTGAAQFGRYSGRAMALAGERCLTLGWAGASSLRELATGREISPGLGVRQASDAAFSPDGTLLAVGSLLGMAKLFDAATFEEVATLRAFLVGVISVAFSPDGKRLVTGSSGAEAMKLWDVESRQELLTLAGQGADFWRTAFSPDGNVLASMNEHGLLHFWRAPSWGEIEAVEQPAVR